MSRSLWMLSLGLASLLVPSLALATGDAIKGAEVFKKCSACHALEPVNKIGPSLGGVIGRPAAHVEGYKYSDAMLKAGQGGLVWSEDNLTQYLAAPKAFIAGNKMTFTGLKNPQDIADLLEYLKSK